MQIPGEEKGAEKGTTGWFREPRERDYIYRFLAGGAMSCKLKLQGKGDRVYLSIHDQNAEITQIGDARL